MQSISLIVCTYKRPEIVKRLLESINDQIVLPGEIIVVDGSLDDRTEVSVSEVTRPVSDRLIYIRVDENDRGLTRQRNVGIRRAHGEIIAFLDDDTVPEKDYFEQLLACFDRHPEAIGVGGQIITGSDWRPANLQKKPSIAAYRWENWEKPESYRWRIRKLLGLTSNLPPGWMPAFGHGRSSNYPSNGNDYPVEFVMGGVSAWRKDLFSSCQFSNYFIGYGLYEDLDFCVRASRIGQIFQCTSAQLEHYHASGGRPNQFAYGKMVVRNGWYVWRRRWLKPNLIDRIKWWEITLILALLRLIDLRSQGPKEAIGRFAGCFSILFSPPRESMKMNEERIHQLLIVSHVTHYQYQGQLFAYAPYAREIELWADLFPEVVIASPLRKAPPPTDCIPFGHQNISVAPQPQLGGDNWHSKIIQVLALPVAIYSLCKVMSKADAIHVRCPGNLGLLGALLAPLFTRYRIAKYAGQWPNYPGESFSTRLQKSLLKSRWWGAPVTVYGQWLHQPAHIVSFFTSLMDDDQMKVAQRSASQRELHSFMRLLYVGRLTKSKHVDTLISAIGEINKSGNKCACRIIGEGPELSHLQDLTREKSVESEVEFIGGLPFEGVLDHYQWADILVLVSETEGWPKAITEAMAFGLVCIGSNRGLVPQILAEDRGVCIDPGNMEQLVNVLSKLQNSPHEYSRISQNASAWSSNYTLEKLRQSLRDLMIRKWDLHEDDLLKIEKR